jgi:DNA-binding MarR family transcriptional regulator
MDRLDVVALLNALQQLERNASIALMYSGLRMSQFRLLSALDVRGTATVTEMSKALRITRASASVAINELLRSGVLAMDEHPNDRRSFHVALTELGRNKLQVARSDLWVFQDKLSRRLSAELIRHLNAFCGAGDEPAR